MKSEYASLPDYIQEMLEGTGVDIDPTEGKDDLFSPLAPPVYSLQNPADTKECWEESMMEGVYGKEKAELRLALTKRALQGDFAARLALKTIFFIDLGEFTRPVITSNGKRLHGFTPRQRG